MIKIYGFRPSPRTSKILAVAYQLSIPFEFVEVDITKGGQRAPHFLHLNPNGRVPVLQEDDFVLWESNAIVQYLSDKRPGHLVPDTARGRAQVAQWLAWDISDWDPACAILMSENFVKPHLSGMAADPVRVKEGEEKFSRTASILDRHLSDRAWLLGDDLSAADFVLASPLQYAVICNYPMKSFGNINRWYRSIERLATWSAAKSVGNATDAPTQRQVCTDAEPSAVAKCTRVTAHLTKSRAVSCEQDLSGIFNPRRDLPHAAKTATQNEKVLLDALVRIIEETAEGMFKNGLEKSYRASMGVTEADVSHDPEFRAYLSRADLDGRVKELVDGLTDNDCRLLYTVLAEIETRNSSCQAALSDEVAREAKFDLQRALEIAAPIIEYYCAKKLPPEAHSRRGKTYHRRFMNSPGLRPNTKTVAIPVNEQLVYHGSCAIILNALKFHRFPEAYAQIMRRFDTERLEVRRQVWNIASSPAYQSGRDAIENLPKVPADAFVGTALASFRGVVPAFVDITLPSNVRIQTKAAVAIHAATRRCLTEFVDYTMAEPVKRYAVSHEMPPLGGESDVSVFNCFEAAYAQWNASGCPMAAISDMVPGGERQDLADLSSNDASRGESSSGSNRANQHG